MGVCMTCPAKILNGQVDQSAGMLDGEVQEKGYALTCVSTPLSDCTVKVIEEEELLDEVLQASKAAAS
jgi:ferredoxin